MDVGQKITLLIADDEAEIRMGLMRTVPWNDYGITVIGAARDGAEALAMVQEYRPDIVLTDIRMPVMDGLALMAQALSVFPQCKFIVLSGYDDFTYAKTALRHGVKDYLLKPIVLGELTNLLQRLQEEIMQEREASRKSSDTLQDLQQALGSIRQNQLVPQLLHQDLTGPELEATLEDLALPIRNTTSQAVMFAISDHPATEDAQSPSHPEGSLQNLLKTQLEQRLEEIPALVSVQNDGRLLLIWNLPLPDSSADWLERFLREVQGTIRCRIYAAAGKESPSLLEIRQSYKSALQLLSWRIYRASGSVIDPSVLEYPEPPRALSAAAVLDCLLQRDEEALARSLEDYFTEMQYICQPPPGYVYSMCNYLIVHLQNAVAKQLGKQLLTFSGDPYLTLQQLDSLAEIKDWVTRTVVGFLRELKIQSLQSADPVFDKTMDYIHRNIFNKIKTEDVCEYVGFSKSYFTTYFKNKTRLNFRDYILELKISYAQEKLKTSEHTPSELATMLGYDDYRSFNRAFKARTGFAPSEYQKKYYAKG